MSPMVTILVIMLLAVVYNESQLVTDYQDVYQNFFKENAILMEFCESHDSVLQRKLCENSLYGWRQLLKDNSAVDYDDEEMQKYRERMNDELQKKFSQSQKRGDSSRVNICETTKSHFQVSDIYFPSMLANVTCKPEFKDRCRPILHKERVLRKRTIETDEIDYMLPVELRRDWIFDHITLEVGCSCCPSK